MKLRILALAGAANVNIPVPAGDPVTPEPRQPQETTHTLTHARVVGGGGGGGGGGRMARLLRCPRLEELQMPSLKPQGRPFQRSQRSVNSHISAFFPLRIRQNVGKAFLGRSFPREARLGAHGVEILTADNGGFLCNPTALRVTDSRARPCSGFIFIFFF